MPAGLTSQYRISADVKHAQSFGHTERSLQSIIDSTPPAGKELVAYALFYGYMSVRLPNCRISPAPSHFAGEPDAKFYVTIVDAIFLIDFSAPPLRPVGELRAALRSPLCEAYIMTDRHLHESWCARIKTWPPKSRNRASARTVPDWITTGLALMSGLSRYDHVCCLRTLIERANECLQNLEPHVASE